MKIGNDKYMQFVYFCIVQNKQNQNQNENSPANKSNTRDFVL